MGGKSGHPQRDGSKGGVQARLSPAAAAPIATCRRADGVIIVEDLLEETAPYEDESLTHN